MTKQLIIHFIRPDGIFPKSKIVVLSCNRKLDFYCSFRAPSLFSSLSGFYRCNAQFGYSYSCTFFFSSSNFTTSFIVVQRMICTFPTTVNLLTFLLYVGLHNRLVFIVAHYKHKAFIVFMVPDGRCIVCLLQNCAPGLTRLVEVYILFWGFV